MLKVWPMIFILMILSISGCTLKFDEPVNNTSIIQPTITPTPTPIPYIPEHSTVYVEIFGSEFNPSVINVVNGTTVQWTNQDSGQHAIYVNNINSPPLNKRETWNYTFNRPGTYEYNCTIQSWMQHGRIIVK
ncbi:MAG: cupredoxin domain-containing protein [Candidatus Methanoperedens sp.]|nr:cupredoxin domain-containing protein [Candidatus Methanoperedens sp.]CAG0976430.1 plastocyanin [Methanosarcinales archaeon]